MCNNLKRFSDESCILGDVLEIRDNLRKLAGETLYYILHHMFFPFVYFRVAIQYVMQRTQNMC